MELKAGYKQTEVGVIPEDWILQQVGEFATTVASGTSQANSIFGEYPVYGSTGIIGFSNKSDYSGAVILVARVGANAGKLNIVSGRYGVTDNTIIVRINDSYNFDYFREQLRAKNLNSLTFGSGQPLITGSQIKNLVIPIPPTKAEQEAIASALSDADALIESLEQLLAKKRHLKQGAMQELLTGKRRLAGFDLEWNNKRLGELLMIRHGKSQHAVESINGKYPILATGGQIGWTDCYLHDKPSVLIGRKGTIDQPQYMDAPFWTVDTLFYSEILPNNNAKFLYYRFCLIDWKGHNEASGVPSLNAKTIERIEILCPEYGEQTAIAAILSDMDTEITEVETKLDKARQIKQGMMQGDCITRRPDFVQSLAAHRQG
jgi:type I restriction enzyme S subunit